MTISNNPPAISPPTCDLDPFSDDAMNDPLLVESQMRDMAPVVYLSKYGCYAATHYSSVSEIMSNWETFSSAKGVGIYDITAPEHQRMRAQLLEMDPPEHTTFRSVHNKVINPKFIRELRERFYDASNELVSGLPKNKPFEAISAVAVAYPMSVFPDLIGVAEVGRENLLPAAALTFNGFGPNNEILARSLEAGQKAQQWLISQAQPGAIKNGLAVQTHEVGESLGLSPFDTTALVFGLLSAGLDTTMHGIGWAIYLLAKNPDQFKKLKENPELARPAFDEAVRLGSPVKWFGRHSTSSSVIDGFTIPEDARVLVFLGAANRDGRRWEDPLEFNIERQTSGHVGFGAGPHSCAGQMLARLEGESVLKSLASYADEIEIVTEPSFDISNSLRGLHSLEIVLR